MDSLGKKLSPILVEIENTLWEFEANYATYKPEYPIDAFRAATKIFMSALMDKMFDLQEKENMDLNDRCEMATKVGEDIRKLIKIYTNIDTLELYKKIPA